MATLTDAVALPPRRLHAYEEHYPQKYKRVGHGRFEERFKILGDLVEEISEVDEEVRHLNKMFDYLIAAKLVMKTLDCF